jgi:hypothetical protein
MYVARADDEVRTAYPQFLTRLIRKMARNMADVAGCSAEDRAWAITAPAVGGLLFSRAVNDEELSDRILAVCCSAAEEM